MASGGELGSSGNSGKVRSKVVRVTVSGEMVSGQVRPLRAVRSGRSDVALVHLTRYREPTYKALKVKRA